MANQRNDNIDAGRIPPQNLNAEEAVLGGILLDKEGLPKVADIVSPDDFYRPDHGEIYSACVSLFEQNKPIDIVTLTEELSRSNKLEKVGGASYLSLLVANTASAANITHYAQIVQNKSVLRRLISTANAMAADAYDQDRDALELLDDAEKKLFSVTERQLGRHFIAIKDVLSESFERIDELHKNKGQVRGVPTGFTQLDNLLAGLQKSDLVILAARPSMGKTALALNIAVHAAAKEKIPVGVFSLEMSKEQLVDRLLTMEAMIDSWRLRTGNLEEDDFAKLNYAMGELSEAPLFLDDTPLLSALEIKAKARRLQAEHGLGLIVVDYLQLMEGRNRGNETNRVQEVSDISRSLKSLARELQVPVLALSQLSRAVESRPGAKIPQLSDLRESGCLTGDTLIYLPSQKKYRKIADLVGKKDFTVLSCDLKTMTSTTDKAVKVFATGTKMVYELKTQLDNRIRATANHQFLTKKGWEHLSALSPGDLIALPNVTPIDKWRFANLQKEAKDRVIIELCKQFPGAQYSQSALEPAVSFELSTAQERIGKMGKTTFELGSYGRSALQRKESKQDRFSLNELKSTIYNIKRKYRAHNNPANWRYHNKAWIAEMPNGETRVIYTRQNSRGMEEIINFHVTKNPNYVKQLESYGIPTQTRTGTSSLEGKRSIRLAYGDELSIPQIGLKVKWDKITSIARIDKQKVYDITTQKHHNFVANNIIVHNSIEQDADVVMFIYREEYYEPDTEKKGIAQLLIRKHRNGPTGEVDLYFHPEYSRFANIERHEKSEGPPSSG